MKSRKALKTQFVYIFSGIINSNNMFKNISGIYKLGFRVLLSPEDRGVVALYKKKEI